MGEGIGKGRRVLVVDDEPSVRNALSSFLEDQEFTVEGAAGLQDALAHCAERSFDLLIVDKNLPDGSGLDLARSFAAADEQSLVIITGYASLASAVEAMRAGVVDYLIKPFDLSELLARLTRVLTIQDLKKRNRQLIEELQRKNEALALDPLTRLYNHAYFQDCLQREVLRSRRHGLEFGLLFVDLDRFKAINDTKGHPTGDRVLTEFAEILRGSTRRTDLWFRVRETDVAARYGGDEFALILPDTSKEGAAVKAETLRAFVEQYDFGSRGLPGFTLSVGVSGFPDDAGDPSGLIAAADTALYAAKNSGRNLIISYTPALVRDGLLQVGEAEAEASRREGLQRFISRRSFEFHYQPIVGATDFALFGYEALCRPADGTFADVGELIAVAERAGKIATLGRVLREQCVAVLADLPPPTLLFVNLHPQELHDPALLDLEPAVKAWRDRIVFELTESARIRDYGRVSEVVARLREHGFRIALDDLGSGYSSLSSLGQIEPDFVKLDVEMVRGIHANRRTARLVKHILEYAREEGIQVIAEGIEKKEELDAVAALGVPYVQGYLVAHPGPPFIAVARRRKRRRARR